LGEATFSGFKKTTVGKGAPIFSDVGSTLVMKG
jgi:hypothetical protein